MAGRLLLPPGCTYSTMWRHGATTGAAVILLQVTISPSTTALGRLGCLSLCADAVGQSTRIQAHEACRFVRWTVTCPGQSGSRPLLHVAAWQDTSLPLGCNMCRSSSRTHILWCFDGSVSSGLQFSWTVRAQQPLQVKAESQPSLICASKCPLVPGMHTSQCLQLLAVSWTCCAGCFPRILHAHSTA